MLSVTRNLQLLKFPASIRPLLAARLYATQTGLGTTEPTFKPKRKQVTAFNDDGRVPWGELSMKERAARTTQQTFNLGIILVGAVLTGGVAYVMYAEVFSRDSKWAQFDKAVDRIKEDSRCIELLGDSKKITAYGEETWNRWRRARPVASSTRKEQNGTEHLLMHFNIEGPLNKGVVNLHTAKRATANEFEYKYLSLDVKGHERIYLENADTKPGNSKNSGKLFGIKWTR